MDQIKQQEKIVCKLEDKRASADKITKEELKLAASEAQLPDNKMAEKAIRKFKLKTPKGTRDFTPRQMIIREQATKKIVDCFERHNAQPLDSPVFELKEVLTGKYGEDSKLMYDLANQGGESLCLRYDLTVSFARWLAQNKMKAFKRYQIGKVYRRDNPAMTRGRFREFIQADFDIAGSCKPMIPDVECIRVVTEILDSLDLKDYVIKINHRKILDGVFEACGVAKSQFRAICSAVDKLDKCDWEEVRREMTQEKGLQPEIADKIGGFVRRVGQEELIEELLEDSTLCSSTTAVEGLKALQLFFRYADSYGVKRNLKFDMSLARGLDYYTGIIFEAVLTDQNSEEGVGSIAGGGRYDDLATLLDPKCSVPCVGVSIGIERILSILEKRNSSVKIRTVKTQVFVVSAQESCLDDRMSILRDLWDSGITADLSYKENPKFLSQMQECEDAGTPLAVIIGQSELERGVVKVREVASRKEEEVKRSQLVEFLKKKLRVLGYV